MNRILSQTSSSFNQLTLFPFKATPNALIDKRLCKTETAVMTKSKSCQTKPVDETFSKQLEFSASWLHLGYKTGRGKSYLSQVSILFNCFEHRQMLLNTASAGCFYQKKEIFLCVVLAQQVDRRREGRLMQSSSPGCPLSACSFNLLELCNFNEEKKDPGFFCPISWFFITC